MQYLHTTLIGRIDFAELHNGRFYTVVTTPAPDAYSHPSRFKLQSAQQIGQLGQTFEFSLDVSGIVREKPYQDKNTGMRKTFYESDVYLNVVSFKPYVMPSQQPNKAQAQG